MRQAFWPEMKATMNDGPVSDVASYVTGRIAFVNGGMTGDPDVLSAGDSRQV